MSLRHFVDVEMFLACFKLAFEWKTSEQAHIIVKVFNMYSFL